MEKVMIAVDPETKIAFRSLPFPSYLKSDDAKVRYLIANWVTE
jgi:hypothetical protein